MKDLKLDEDDYRQMIAVQKELADVLRKINDRGNVPQAFLVSVALMRLAANLLNMYPEAKRPALRLIAEKLMEYGTITDPSELHRVMPRVTLH